MMPNERELRELTSKYGQDHVWRWWPELDDDSRGRLLADLARVDFAQLDSLVKEYIESPPAKFSGALEPAEILSAPASEQARRREANALAEGENALREGKVAALVVAGGQGTRLGFDRPKGAFPITPIRAKSLFQLHAERIRAASSRYGRPIPWCIMTSEATDAATREFFREHDNFGLPGGDVFFFVQDVMPSVDGSGRRLLARKGRLAMSPNGHGGTIAALFRGGTLDALAERGIEIISYFQVDNVLVKPVDPVFIGYHVSRSAEMSSKVLHKREWAEKLGIIGRSGGGNLIIEYMNMHEKTLKQVSPNGHLKYWAGSIAIHLFDLDFIRRLNETGTELPYHASEKKIPHINETGVLVKPPEPNGLKFERFVFDALPHAREIATMEIRREEEFSPVKNSDEKGVDCPSVARADLQKRWGRWLDECDVHYPVEEDGTPAIRIEISPLTALDADELRHKLPDDFSVTGDVDL